MVASGDTRVKAVQMAGRGRPRGHQVWVPGTARLRDRVSRPHDPGHQGTSCNSRDPRDGLPQVPAMNDARNVRRLPEKRR
jgi:hypothetical protein